MMIRQRGAKHCPFCGGHTICVESKDNVFVTWTQSTAYKIGCADCGCCFNFVFPTAGAAIEAWNLRADVSKPDLYAAGWNDAMGKVSRYAGHQVIKESEAGA